MNYARMYAMATTKNNRTVTSKWSPLSLLRPWLVVGLLVLAVGCTLPGSPLNPSASDNGWSDIERETIDDIRPPTVSYVGTNNAPVGLLGGANDQFVTYRGKDESSVLEAARFIHDAALRDSWSVVGECEFVFYSTGRGWCEYRKGSVTMTVSFFSAGHPDRALEVFVNLTRQALNN